MFHDNRSLAEYANIFSLVLHLIELNEIGIGVEPEISQSLDQTALDTNAKAKLLAFFRFQSLLADLIESSSVQFSVDVLLASARLFIKVSTP